MLKQRLITGLIAAALALLGVFYLPPWGFALFAGAVLLAAGGREVARLAGFDARVMAVNMVLMPLAGAVAWLWLWREGFPWLIAAGAAAWIVPLLWLSNFDLGRSDTRLARAVKLACGWIVLFPAWAAIVWLQAESPWLVLLLALIVHGADIGAYFAGTTFGGPKLAPRISPGKTWAGVGGGLLAGALFAAIAVRFMPDMTFTPPIATLLALPLVLVSIGGDLFASLLKRHIGLKDTGRLLPGHGGVLDRFDSLCAALPFFALAVLVFK